MRSRISRPGLEWVSRGIALLALLVLLARAWLPVPAVQRESATTADLATALPRWTTEPEQLQLALRVDRIPGAAERDWLAGLRRTGVDVSWRGRLEPLAITVSPSAEPIASYVIHAAGAGSPLRFSDAVRELAALRPAESGMSLRSSTLAGSVIAAAASGEASAAVPPPPRVGRVAVLGAAGWETKFMIAALEERGWQVDARIGIAPDVFVGGFNPAMLDTARYSAVVVLDETGVQNVTAVARFVRSGGGAVFAGAAAHPDRMADLAPGLAVRPVAVVDTAIVDREALGGTVFTEVRAGAAVIEARGDNPIVAAARFGAGRVVAIGYAETWRWRMLGGEESPFEHRQWWSALVGSAAYAPDTAFALAANAAPVASLVAALGPSSEAAAQRRRLRVSLEWALYGVLVVALLVEIISRRTRGLP